MGRNHLITACSTKLLEGSFVTTVFWMALGRGLCSDTSGKTDSPSIALLCRWSKTIATDLSRADGQII
jgi:hypothetical protein